MSVARVNGREPVVRYRVVIAGRETCLYHGGGRWWVDDKVYGDAYVRGGDYPPWYTLPSSSG